MIPTSAGHRRPLVLAGVVFLGALALRLWRADAQSLWYDEGTSVALAARSLAEIARDASRDIHPPLYYWLLALWTRAFGDGVATLRALSALLGAGTVAGVFALGRRLWGEAEGLAAGALAAVSPYLWWYSQEVRMYALAAALAVALVWLALDRLDDAGFLDAAAGERPPSPRRRRAGWALTGLVTLAALGTHYLAGATALGAADLVVAIAVASAWRRTGAFPSRFVVTWTAVQAAAIALFLPWLSLAWPALRDWPAVSPPTSAAFLAREALSTFAVGIHPPEVRWPLVGLAALGAAVGLGAAGRGGRRWGWRVAGPWAAAAPALMGLAGLSRPAWNPKFLIGSAPAFELLAGAGVVLLARRALRGRSVAVQGLAAGTLLLALALPRLAILRAEATDPALQRDEYRGVARAIEALAGPRDAVVLSAPTQVEVFAYYDRGRHATYPLPRARPPDRAATLRELEGIGRRHDDVYGVLWAAGDADPEGIVTGWLDRERYKAFDRWFGGIRLALWAAPSGPMAAGAARLPTRFGEEIVLERLDHPVLEIAAGDVLTLELRWRALRSPAADYVVFTQLVDGAGTLVAQRDMMPAGGAERTSTWSPKDEPLRDRIGLLVPRATPAGTYRLILGLYDPSTGRRLPVAAADHFEAGEVQVLPGP